MAGGYLRTNYRRAIQRPEITAIGGGIPKSSQAGGAGTKDGYGGFIWLSWTGTVVHASDPASIAGISSRVVLSTTEIMDSFYGTGVYPDGFAFLPVVAHPMSATGWILSAGEQAAGDNVSLVGIYCVSFRHSGSYAIFTPLILHQDTADDYTWLSLSDAAADFQIGGFIISAPDMLT
jgi:hypothetical protein